jgi:hypothetical protein
VPTPRRRPAKPAEGDPKAKKPTEDPPAPRGKKRRLLKEISEEVLKGEARLMVDASTLLRAIFRGEGVSDSSVDAEVFSSSVGQLTKLLSTMTGARPQIYAFGFGQSVYVDIGPSEDELDRADEALGEYERAQDDKTKTDAQRSRLAEAAVPETLLAVLATSELIESSADDVVGSALSYGTQVSDAYKGLVRVLAEEDISMDLELHGERFEGAPGPPIPVEEALPGLSSEVAREYREALTAAGSEEIVKITAVGILTMADSGRRQVRLTLDPKAKRDPALPRRQLSIIANYSPAAGRNIKEQGLWDNEVIARVEMTRDRRGSTAHVRRPTFRLISAKPRYG